MFAHEGVGKELELPGQEQSLPLYLLTPRIATIHPNTHFSTHQNPNPVSAGQPGQPRGMANTKLQQRQPRKASPERPSPFVGPFPGRPWVLCEAPAGCTKGSGCSGERQIDVLCVGEEGCHWNPCEPRLLGQRRLTAFVGHSSLSKLCFIDSRLGGPGLSLP